MTQLPPLPNLSASDVLLLQPGDPQFAQYQTSFNTLTELTPRLRALCKTANAASVMVKWCRDEAGANASRAHGPPRTPIAAPR